MATWLKCVEILNNCGQPEKVKEHCRAVADCAFALAEAFNRRGLALDAELCRRAGLLHDICRTLKWHSQYAMIYLLERGLRPEALIVGAHMGEYIDTDRIREKEVVYLADKITQGTQRVCVEERYERSLEKFTGNEDAVRAALARRDQSLALAAFAEAVLGVPLHEFERAGIKEPDKCSE